MRVDLPEPDGPMMVTYSLRAMSSETPRRACTSSAPMTYVFTTSLSDSVTPAAGGGGFLVSRSTRLLPPGFHGLVLHRDHRAVHEVLGDRAVAPGDDLGPLFQTLEDLDQLVA